MGTWDLQGFENDDAMDFLDAFIDAPSAKLILEALRKINEAPADQYLESPECQEAVAAAEIVAALIGSRIAKPPEKLVSWLDAGAELKPDRSLVEGAARAVARIAKESELQELWEESDEFSAWQSEMVSLQNRLSAKLPRL